MISLVQKLAKLLGSLQLFSQTGSQLFSPRFALRKANAFVAKLRAEFLNLRAEFLNLRLVPGFRLRKEFLVELLDLRNPFRN
jgi:hypothetical protein